MHDRLPALRCAYGERDRLLLVGHVEPEKGAALRFRGGNGLNPRANAGSTAEAQSHAPFAALNGQESVGSEAAYFGLSLGTLSRVEGAGDRCHAR